jgi:dihydrofolate reductase
MLIDVIVSYSDKYIIGNNNDLPWNYEEDSLYFDKITSERTDLNKKNILVYGYNSHKNIKLDGRIKMVITTKVIDNHIENDIYYVDSLGKCMELSRMMIDNGDAEKIFICGGESIYKYFFTSYYYKFLDKIYITRIDKSYEGNKTFYGLEEKFYYIHTEKSETSPIEFRVLQYDNELIRPEATYIEYLQELSKIDKNEDLFFEFQLDIDLSRYFPVFSLIKKDINNMISQLFNHLKNDKIMTNVNRIIDSINNNIHDGDDLLIDLNNTKPFESKYMFKVENNKLYSLVEHSKGNIFNEILFNIIFSSLLVVLIAKITNLTPSILNYDCDNASVSKNQEYIINKVAWNTPDVLPLIFIKSSNQNRIEDFQLSDISFGGLII